MSKNEDNYINRIFNIIQETIPKLNKEYLGKLNSLNNYVSQLIISDDIKYSADNIDINYFIKNLVRFMSKSTLIYFYFIIRKIKESDNIKYLANIQKYILNDSSLILKSFIQISSFLYLIMVSNTSDIEKTKSIDKLLNDLVYFFSFIILALGNENVEELLFLYKFLIRLSLSYSNEENKSDNEEVISYEFLISPIKVLGNIGKLDSLNIKENKKYNKVLIETLLYINKIINKNKNNSLIYNNTDVLALINLLNKDNAYLKNDLLNVITDTYSFYYNKNTLNFLLENARNNLEVLSIIDEIEDNELNCQEIKEKYINQLENLFFNFITNIELVDEIEVKEEKILNQDKYLLKNSFIFPKREQSIGLNLYKTGNELLNRNFTLVFSFKFTETFQENTEYTLFNFTPTDSNSKLLSLSLFESYINITAKNINVVNYKIEKNITYLIILEKTEKNRFLIRINGYNNLFTFDNRIKFCTKCNINIGYSSSDNIRKNSNFVGEIGTIIFFSEIFNDELSENLYKFLFSLYGYYDYLLLLNNKNDINQIKYRKNIDSFEYIQNHYKLIEEYILFNISPLSLTYKVIKKNIHLSSLKLNKSKNSNFIFYEENYFDRLILNNLTEPIYFFINSNNRIIYPVTRNRTINQYIKYDGFSYLCIPLEFIYNFLRIITKKKKKVKDVFTIFHNENTHMLLIDLLYNTINMFIKLLKNIEINIYKNEINSFGFSFAKCIRLLSDYYPINSYFSKKIFIYFLDIIFNINSENILLKYIFGIKLFNLVIDPCLYLYNNDIFENLKLLFELLYKIISNSENQMLISVQTLELIMKFKFLLDFKEVKQYLDFNEIKDDLFYYDQYKNLIKIYKKIIGYLIFNGNINILTQFLNLTFDTENNNNNLFKTSSSVVILKLLELFYLFKPKLYENNLEGTYKSNKLFIDELVEIIIGYYNKYINKYNKGSKDYKILDKTEGDLVDCITSFLILIIYDDKKDFDFDIKQNEGELINETNNLATSIKEVINEGGDDENDLKAKTMIFKPKVTNALPKLKQKRSIDINDIITARRKSSLKIEQIESSKTKMQPFNSISFILFKALFACLYEDTKINNLNLKNDKEKNDDITNEWCKKQKIRFVKFETEIKYFKNINKDENKNSIKSYNDFNFRLVEWNPQTKDILYKIVQIYIEFTKDNLRLQIKIAKLLFIFFNQIIDSYIAEFENDKQSYKCQFIHLFESRKILIPLFDLITKIIANNLNDTKNQELKNDIDMLYENQLKLFNNLLNYHSSSFIIYFFECSKVINVKYLLTGILSYFYSDVIDKFSITSFNNNQQDTPKNISIVFFNLFNLLNYIRKLNISDPKDFCLLVKENQYEFYNLLEIFICKLLSTVFIFDNNLYYNEEKAKDRNFYIYKTFILSLAEILFSISHIKRNVDIKNEYTGEEAEEISLNLNAAYIDSILQKAHDLSCDDHFIFYYADLNNNYFNFKKDAENDNKIAQCMKHILWKDEKTLFGLNIYKFDYLVTLIFYIYICVFFLECKKTLNEINNYLPNNFPLLKKDLEFLFRHLIPEDNKRKKSLKELKHSFYIDYDNYIITIIYKKVYEFMLKSKKGINFKDIDKIITKKYKKYKIKFNGKIDIFNNINTSNIVNILNTYLLDLKNRKRKDSFSECDNHCKSKKMPEANVNYSILLKSRENYPYSFYDLNIKYPIICTKRDLLLAKFGFVFYKPFFENKKFIFMGNYFKYLYNPNNINNSYYGKENEMNMKYPSTIKNFSFWESFYPKIFLRPDKKFFKRKYFEVGHKYFSEFNKVGNKNSKFNLNYPDNKLNYLAHGLLYSKDFNFFSTKYKLENKNSVKEKIFECELHSNSKVLYGKILVNMNYLVFQTDKTMDVKKEYNSNVFYLFSTICYDVAKIKKQIIIYDNNIEQIVSRNFIFMPTALEIFLKNGKNYFFNFFNEKNRESILKTFKEYYPKAEFISDPTKIFYDQSSTIQWLKGRINSFDYLLQINKVSNRSYNELNQYPIFPWIIRKFNIVYSDIKFRKMEFPVSIQLEQNQEQAKKKYYTIDGKYKNHFQVHYSNESFVNNYLVRIAPFTYNQIKFQTNSFDSPNRQLNSFKKFLDLLQEMCDNRELIPEMFCMIESLINLNYNFFGFTQEISLCNNIACDGIGTSSISFLINHRWLLENKLVKENINKWIDNIFGIYQYLNDENILNIYPKYCYSQYVTMKYHEYIDLYNNEEKNIKDIPTFIKKVRKITMQSITIGITPTQIFKNKHPVYVENNMKSLNQINKLTLLNIRKLNKALFINRTSNKNYLYVLFVDEIYLLDILNLNVVDNLKINSLDNVNLSGYFDVKDEDLYGKGIRNLKIFLYKYKIFDFNDGKFFAMCFDNDNIIKVYKMKEGLVYKFFSDSGIECIIKGKEKEFLSGHDDGRIIKWKIKVNFLKYSDKESEEINTFTSEQSQITFKQKLSVIAHQGKIVAMELSKKHNLFISGDEYNTIFIRKYYNFEVINVINLNVDRIVDISIGFNNLIYITTYDKIKLNFSLLGYTFNFIPFASIHNDVFLPLIYNEKNMKIFCGLYDSIYSFDGALVRKTKLTDISKEFKNMLNNRTNNSNDSLNDEFSYDMLDSKEIISYYLDKKKNILYCLLNEGEIFRISLESFHEKDEQILY